MTNMIVAGLVVAVIVSPTLCYPSDRQEVENEWFQTESPMTEGAENEWFQTESPVGEGAENEWFQPPTPVEGIVTSLKTLTNRCKYFFI